MLQQAITDAVCAIPVPPTLEADILAACRRASLMLAKPPATRYIPAVATAATCAAVLGVTLLSTGHLGEQIPTQPDNSTTPTHHTTIIPSQPTTTPSQSATSFPTTTTAHGESTTVTAQKTPCNTVLTPQSTTASIGTQPTGGSMQKDFISWLSTVSDYELMTDAQLEAYYGRRILPTYTPDGLERRMTDGGDRGIFRRNEEKLAENPVAWNNLLKNGVIRDDEVVFDRTLVTYADFIDGRRELTVGVSTAPYPRYNLGDLTRFDETLTVAGVTVQLHRYNDAPYSDQWCYTALAVVGEVEYLVEAWNLTEEEFLATLTSLLE